MQFATVDLSPIYNAAVLISVVIVGAAVGLVTVLFKTIAAQKDYIGALEQGKRNVELELKEEKATSSKLHEQNRAEIKRLNSRIDALRDIPLADIHKFMSQMGDLIEKTYLLLSTMNIKTVESITTETKQTIGGKQ